MQPILTCVVAGIQYLIHPQELGTIQETINPNVIIPVTLLSSAEVWGDVDAVLRAIDAYDDVFTPEFGQILIEKPGGSHGSQFDVVGEDVLPRQLYHLQDDVNALDVDFGSLPPGPYFLQGPNLHQAFRLYDDELEAFAHGVIPDDVRHHTGFQPTGPLSLEGHSKSIPVPSRLYRSIKHGKPLSGVRVAVADLTSLNGTLSTYSSRAWASVYTTASNSTASITKKLVDLGAVVVGKTKSSQLGTGKEWVDEQLPWSARGDGYQKPEGAGATASLTGYEWLQNSIDIAFIGQSKYDGVYSMALSPKRAPLEPDIGVMTRYDRIRVHSRSLEDLLRLTTQLVDNPTELASGTRIILPVDLIPSEVEDEKNILNQLTQALEAQLKTKAEHVKLAEKWSDSPPAEADKEQLEHYMGDAPFRSWCYEYYRAFSEFRDEYKQKFNKNPFVEATPQYMWDVGAATNSSQHDEDLGRLQVFKTWFDKHIMASDGSRSQPSALVVLPCSGVESEYRDQPVGPPSALQGLAAAVLAPLLEAPQLMVPFAQVPYKSRISGIMEYRPVAACVMGPPGSETSLVQAVSGALKKAGLPTEVETGRLAFPYPDPPQFAEQGRGSRMGMDSAQKGL